MEYVGRQKSHGKHALLCQPAIPIHITTLPLGTVMRITIDLNRERGGTTIEIGHEPTDRMLAPKA